MRGMLLLGSEEDSCTMRWGEKARDTRLGSDSSQVVVSAVLGCLTTSKDYQARSRFADDSIDVDYFDCFAAPSACDAVADRIGGVLKAILDRTSQKERNHQKTKRRSRGLRRQ